MNSRSMCRVTTKRSWTPWTGSGGVSVPLGEQLSMRVAAQSESLGGWVENAATGHDSEEVERDSGRITLAWEPSSTFDTTLVYETQEYEGQGMPAELITATPEAFALSAFAGFPGLETEFDRVSASSDSRVEDAFREDSSADRASLTAHWHIGEFLVTSQTAWSQSDSDARAGADFLPGDYFYQVTELDADALSQELRLTSPADKRFRYVAGAYSGRTIRTGQHVFRQLSGRTAFGRGHDHALRPKHRCMVAVRSGGFRPDRTPDDVGRPAIYG